MIIGITGKAKSGKDTVAHILQAKIDYSLIYSFASPVKAMCSILGFTTEQLYDQDYKEVEDEFWNITPRKLMQLVGTDMFRQHFREDVWVKCAERFIEEYRDRTIIIPDVRFDNEAELIHSYGGELIKINREVEVLSDMERNHSSEAGIDNCYITYNIDNQGSIDKLREETNKFYSERICK